MKQSYGRLLAARLMSPAAAMGLAAAAVVGVSACHNSSSTPCPNLSQATTVLGQSTFATGANSPVNASSMSSPQSVGYDPALGNLYVADTFNNRVLVFKGFTSSSSFPANGTAADYVLGQPCFESTTAAAGATTSVPAICGSGVLNAYGLNKPTKVWVDPNTGNTAITDSGNNRVLIFTSPPTDSTVGPNVIVGQTSIDNSSPNMASGSGTTNSVNASGLATPYSAIIVSGKLAVADKGNNRVLIWSTVPTTDGAAADDELGQLAENSAGGDVCTTNTGVSGSTGYCFASNTTNQGDTFILTNSSYQVAMNAPTDLGTNGSTFYVTDSGDNRVIVYTSFPAPTSATSLSPYNQQPQYFLGQAKFNLITSASGSQGLFNPGGVFSDGSSNLYVADTSNNRILQYNPVTVFGQAAVYVFGQQDFSHTAYNDPDQNNEPGDQRNNPPTLNAVNGTLWSPGGVLANSSLNMLFVADTTNNRVLIYPEETNGVSDGVNGTFPNLCS